MFDFGLQMKMKSKVLILGFCITLIFSSCEKNSESGQTDLNNNFDVILVIGQSNTHQGIGLDVYLDRPYENIKQLGRFEPYNYKIILAKEPLDHLSKLPNNIGFALTFAKKYSDNYLNMGNQVLIIPEGMGITGFSQHSWNKGDTLYNDAVTRTNYVLQNFKSKLVAILWHQGENDVGNPNYQQNLDSMITNIRKDIIGDNSEVPFILGGMVPYWVDQDTNRININNIIETTVNRIAMTGYANPRLPYVINKPDNEYIAIHFNAEGQRELGLRYFSEYQRLVAQ